MANEFDRPPVSTFEKILRAMIDGTEYSEDPRSVMEALLLELNEKIKNAKIYKVAGSKAFSELGQPTAAYVGLVYSITDEFTIDNRFIDYDPNVTSTFPAGTNVVGIVDVDPVTSVETYYWDTLSGFIDLGPYLLKTEAAQTYVAKTDLGTTVPSLDANGKIPAEQIATTQINGIDLYGDDNSLSDLGVVGITTAELSAMWDN